MISEKKGHKDDQNEKKQNEIIKSEKENKENQNTKGAYSLSFLS